MTQTKTMTGRVGAEPGVMLDRTYVDLLESLVYGAQRKSLVMAERLLDELMRATIVDPAEMPPNVVSIGNAVTYRDEATGRAQTVSLVFPGEADIALGRVSVLTPIGVALLGLTEGASFWWDTRSGETRRLTVTRVVPVVAPDGQRIARPGDAVDEAPKASFPGPAEPFNHAI